MSRLLFEQALAAARELYTLTPAMREFRDWPDDLLFVNRPASPVPATELMPLLPGAASGYTRHLQRALAAISPFVEWRHTYSEAEVGRDFLDRYGWFELVGPHGHFHSAKLRMTVGYWGPDLWYPWHEHGPEELYTIVSGSALTLADGEEDRRVTAGETRLHQSRQRHALQTEGQPLLAFVLWRGEGLDAMPQMSAA